MNWPIGANIEPLHEGSIVEINSFEFTMGEDVLEVGAILMIDPETGKVVRYRREPL